MAAPKRTARSAWAGLVCLVLCAAVPATAFAAGPVAAAEAWDSGRAWEEIERLQAEIAVLKGLAAVQAALLDLNQERAGSGGGPAVVDARLCAEPALEAWCRALPATFGEQAGNAAGAQAEDGR